MVGINVTGFIGATLGKDPQLIPETSAVSAKNQRVESGALDPIVLNSLIKPIRNDTRFVYRIPNVAPADVRDGWWIEFRDRDTDMVRTPVVNDGYKRHYWASPSTGFRYATQDQLINGGEFAGLVAGVPRPPTPVTLDVIAGTGNGDTTIPKVTRDYVVTFVSDLGEEGPPSPAAEATGYPSQDWRLRDIPQPVIQAGYTDITYVRVYRTVTAASGSTVFNRVVDLPVGQLIYVDRLSDIQVSGALQLDSTNADLPPSMDGLALRPNGVLVGFKGNNLYFSDSYKPHSWPAAYTLAVQHPVVGLGVFGSTCVVMTQGNPCAVTGNSGATMSLTQSDTSLPCLSRQSIVVAPEGVYYASVSGVVLYGPSGPSIISRDIFGKDAWELRYFPSTVDAALYRGSYAGARNVPEGYLGFVIASGTVVDLDLGGQGYIGLDIYSNKPWIIVNAGLYEWLPVEGDIATAVWRSKQFVLLNRVTLGVGQIDFDDAPGAVVTIRVIPGDGYPEHYQQVISKRPFRLPAGFKTDTWQFEVTTNVRVHKVILAETIQDLKRV